jgi:diguanylate cyclase (GGDEF)-like protein
VAAIAVAGVVLVRFDRLTLRGFHLVAVAGVGLVSIGAWSGGVADSPVWAMYLGIVFYSVYFFERKEAGIAVLLVAAAYSVVCVLDSTPLDVWLFTNGVMASAGFLVVLIKERIQALIARLDEQARTDPLTGLLNRRGFELEVEAELERAERYGRPFALLSADINGFKLLNDARGHVAGDAALQRVAHVLRAAKRAADHIARVGGDEFMVLVPESSGADARALVARLERAIDQAFSDEPLGLTVSFGVADFPDDGGNLDELYRASDQALYRAKGRGNASLTSA